MRDTKKKKQESGITLIALVITIIILLILAGISIAMLTGENGLLTKAQEASEKYKIEAAREKIMLAILEYQANKENIALYDALIKVEGLTKITPNEEEKYSGPPYTVVVDEYEFRVQEKEGTKDLEVIYIAKEEQQQENTPEIKIEYNKEKTEKLEIDITAKTQDKEGLKQMIVKKKRIEADKVIYEEIPIENEGKIEGQEVKIKVQIPVNGEYEITVIGKNDQIAKKEITIDNIEAVEKDTILATITAGEVIENHVNLTIRGETTKKPIKAMELYVDGKKVTTYEYQDLAMEKEEKYTIENLEFYKDTPCYVKVINTEDQNADSIQVKPKNISVIATAVDLTNLGEQVNEKGNTFGGKSIHLIADITTRRKLGTNRILG